MDERTGLIFILTVCLLALALDWEQLARTKCRRECVPDEVDFGGKTVTIVSSILESAAFRERIAEAEEAFNVNIETLLIDNADLMMARIMSGDAKYDIIQQAHRSAYFALVTADAVPADDYLPEEYFEWLPSMDRYTIEKFKYEGKRYGVALHDGVVNDSIIIMSYNKDLLEQYNLPDPYELYLNGEWTVDVLEEMMIAVTQDTNGDGVIDQWGMPDITNGPGFFRWAPFNGAEIAVQDENGRWTYAYNQENAIYALNKVIHWKNLGIIGPGNYNNGTLAFNPTHLPGNRHAQAAGVNFGLVPLPKGPHVDRLLSGV